MLERSSSESSSATRCKGPSADHRRGNNENAADRLAVGVLIDLKRVPESGGQVKCWERFAEAAVSMQDQLDLTLHFQGDKDTTIPISDNVRYVAHAPVLSTARFNSMEHIADHTDLAPIHPRLLSYLPKYDVIHTTYTFFAMARTANHFSRRNAKPLVNSIHTDVPRYARVYGAQIIGRLFKPRGIRDLLLGRFRLDELCHTAMKWASARYLKKCDWVFVSKAEDFDWVISALPGKGVSYMRRGIDKDIFHPKHRNRKQMEETLGIPKNRHVLLFVGRVDPSKNAMLLAEAARILLAQGEPIHLLVVGNGADKETIRSVLGPAVTFTGAIPQDKLPWLYASADLFVFPSETEVYPNVVLESKASGLPVLVSSKGGSAQLVRNPGIDGFVLTDGNPQLWARVISRLCHDPSHREWISTEARKQIETEAPSWRDVLRNDLLPVWQRVVNGGSPVRPS